MTPYQDDALLEALAQVAMDAGARVMSHFGCASEAKADGSPVTRADTEAEDIILDALARLLPGLPVLAEEAAGAGRLPGDVATFACVDPLDGTREFIAGSDEFTVNIALVEAGAATAGVVYAPARARLWTGAKRATARAAPPGARLKDLETAGIIQTRARPRVGGKALVSRSHGERAADAWLAEHGFFERELVGSSLKFALIAEGLADVTVRFTPINEWDVAAGHAVLAAAGGGVFSHDGEVLAYGRRNTAYRTEPFVACGRRNDLFH